MRYSFLLTAKENAVAVLNESSTIHLKAEDIEISGTSTSYSGSKFHQYFHVQGSPESDILLNDNAPIKIKYNPLAPVLAVVEAGISTLYVEDISIVNGGNLADEVHRATGVYLPIGYSYTVENKDGQLDVSARHLVSSEFPLPFAFIGNFSLTIMNISDKPVGEASSFIATDRSGKETT